MREMVQQVLATEQEANRMVEAAKAEAERDLSEVRKKAQELIMRTRQAAREEAASLVEGAVGAAQQAKQERLAQLANEIKAEVQLDENTRQQAVAGIVRFVSGEL